ncbi:MAG: ABC transporter ATP-binding protein [Pseudomonadota bacterium]|nr:ABC transporter ATP-binding protein [Pseudomonadota bacterium]
MASVSIRNLVRRFGTHAAVDSVDLDIADGEFLCVLGPSGCGKTTLLRLIAGLERPDAGEIAFDGQAVSTPERVLAPERRQTGVVFQSYALWPHMTVAENAGFSLRAAGIGGAERRRRIDEALAAVRLSDFAERKPGSLSGGQQQRVALARCLVQRPKVVLMDEPLANLDVHLREEMLGEFTRFHAATGATIVYITHDQAEAMSIAGRIAVMDRGRLLQVATPEVLYHRPASRMVANFIGLSALVETSVAGDGRTAALAGTPVPLVEPVAPGPATLVVRPEQVRLGGAGLPARVAAATYLGERWKLELALPGLDVPLLAWSAMRRAAGEAVPVSIDSAWAVPA